MTRDEYAEKLLHEVIYQDTSCHLCLICDQLPNAHTFPGGRYFNEKPGNRWTTHWKLTWRYVVQVARHDADVRIAMMSRGVTRE